VPSQSPLIQSVGKVIGHYLRIWQLLVGYQKIKPVRCVTGTRDIIKICLNRRRNQTDMQVDINICITWYVINNELLSLQSGYN
jgi:hypothetical protein